jgi:hypothetical protein
MLQEIIIEANTSTNQSLLENYKCVSTDQIENQISTFPVAKRIGVNLISEINFAIFTMP